MKWYSRGTYCFRYLYRTSYFITTHSLVHTTFILTHFLLHNNTLLSTHYLHINSLPTS